MKIKRFLQGLAAFAIIALFAGCTNILDSKTAEKSKENTSVSINFNANGRYISAGSFELNRITSWKVTFEPKGDSNEKDIELAWPSETSDSSSNSNTPSLNYSEGVLNAKLIPTGIYDITLEGSYSEENSTVTVSGTKKDVTVSAETAKNYITVLVGLKKDSSVSGSLELSFNTTDISNYAPALLGTLKNIQTGDIKYSTEKKNLDFGPSADGSLCILTGENIAPGWYKLEFYHSDSVKIEIPGDKMMVEIASGIKTTDSDIKLSGTFVKKYYATNDNSESDQKMNGLSVSSRKNLTALLETLTKNWPDVPQVEIFMDNAPAIDIKTFNELKKTLGDSKNLSIYLGESTSPIIAAYLNSDTNAVNTDLSGSAWLVATDGNKNFEITNLSVGQDQANSIDITLKNGACLDVTGEMSFSGNLNIYAIKDSEDGTVQDNFASYIATPFYSSVYHTDLYNFYLRESASKEVSEHNTIISVPKEAGGDSCEFYIKPASMKGITAESSDKFSIGAYYSSGSDSNVYVSGSAIPYESSYLEIKLNYSEGIEIKNCLWYLNGESFDDSGSELTGFDPTQSSSLKVDGTNVISCFASVGEKLYLCEFKFTFLTPTRSAAVWFSGEQYNYSMKQIYDYTDSTVTESTIKENLTSKYYCFDKNYNLWTAIPGNALTLNKYSMKVSTGSYSDTPDLTNQLSEITSLSDMYYDCVNEYIYLLVEGDSAVSVYAVSTGAEPAIVESVQIDSSNLKTTTLTNIAVNGNDFYFADKFCNVYKATGTVTSDSIAIKPPTLVKELATSDILEGYDSSKHDDYYDSISITDLQFGDGLGYGTENVYALVKETSSSIGMNSPSTDYFYSRGALVQINTTNDSIEKFGWTSKQTTLSYTDNGGSYTDYYYIPDVTDSANTAFFGPEKFCAVVPKKIVIVDDGFYWKAGDSGDGVIKNKDSIVEFDIDSSTLAREDANISVSFKIGTSSYYNGKTEE
ncbi:hypothetical protein [uncultured Treponema sp.]|uniref:hypothetical protein n=1 Tax=uncultured Treponema sp. TaxID=162155 RepID=UPI00259763F7|nr:hypothetical protein [uncultured Treponema sp.]